MTAARILPPTRTLPDRLTSLDGLRGVASVVVLVHHALLTVPLLARAYYPGQTPVPHGSPAWWLSYTPLHLAWAGAEAVCLFFVLSGIVVVLPALRDPRFDWLAFYPRRIIRIYGPVAGALALAVVLAMLVPRFDAHALGPWMNGRPNTLKASDLLRDLLLVDGNNGFVSPLWSLQWEMIFSAFLPAFVVLAILARRRPRIVGAVVTGTVVLASVLVVPSLFYIALFAVGALLVAVWGRLAALGDRLSRSRVAFPLVLLAGLAAASATWWLQGLGLSGHRATMMRWVEVVGVVLLLLVAAFWRPAARALDGRVFQWLGRISFSLYLVHEPIVTTVRFALVHVHAPTWTSIAISIPLSLGVAALFTRLVEAPFHRLARTVGSRVARLSSDALPRPTRTEPAAATREPSLVASRARSSVAGATTAAPARSALVRT